MQAKFILLVPTVARTRLLGFLTSCAVCSYRVIKLEMFWVLSMRLLVKNHIFHVFHKMFPEDTTNYSFYK